jgi:hypothetical protein
MKLPKLLMVCCMVTAILTTAAYAEVRTVTLAVSGMT